MKNESIDAVSTVTTAINTLDFANDGDLPFTLTNDYLFRALLQENVTVLNHLLSHLLPISYEDIQSTTILNPIILGEAIDEKTSILDLHIKLNDNRIINIEMQVIDYDDWPERSLYYLCKAFTNLKKGASYIDVLPTMHIGILNYTLFPDAPEFYSEHFMANKKTHKIYSDKFCIKVLDLKQVDTDEAKKLYPELNYWAKLFAAKTWKEVSDLCDKSEGIRDAATTLKKLTNDEKVKLQCEARERYERDQIAMRRLAERKEAEALALGHSLGSKETSIETAKKMIQDQMPIDLISKYTSLSEQEIRNIQ